MKRTLTSLLITAMMLMTTLIPAGVVYAATDDDPAVLDGKTVKGMTEEELDEQSVMGHWAEDEFDDGDSIDNCGATLMSSANAWAKRSDGTFFNGTGTKVLTGALSKGVDVSSWQKTIDWSKVKKTDVTFAIIRMGFGSDYPSQDDAKFKYNVEQCEKYGIPYGFYLYSYANTAAKNKSEIAHVKRLLKGTHPTYPVYYDIEDGKTTGKCKNATIQSYAENFCKEIKAAGYTPGIYASLYWWRNKLECKNLDAYEKWVAQYNNSVTGCSYSGKNCGIWQSASDYKTSGITGRVDVNFTYKKYTKSSSSGSTISVNTNLAEGENLTSEDEVVAAPSVKKGWITDASGKLFYYYEKNKLYKSKWFTVSGKKYYATSTGAVYKDAYKKIGNYYYGFDSKGAMYKGVTKTINGKKYTFTDKGYAVICKVKTKANLNYRTGAGKKFKSKGLFKKNKELKIICKNGKWWQTSGGYWVHKDYLKVIE
ncbi:MAG: hypothetical protein KBS66_03000 [Eubacterium sp.]|nr:hypothetical protein [Candidatus Colimonas fimequi]